MSTGPSHPHPDGLAAAVAQAESLLNGGDQDITIDRRHLRALANAARSPVVPPGAAPTPVEVAIAALTAAARPVDPATGSVREADMGGILCRVITSVAANLDGPGALLAGRPGSWEAALIGQVVEQTAGPHLAGYRTVPFVLQLNPEMLFSEWGLEDLYDEAMQALLGRADAVATNAAGVVTEAGQAALEDITVDEVAVETLRQADLDAVVASYTAAATAAAAERGLIVPVEVQVVVVDAGPPPYGDLVESLHAAGLGGVVLPSGLTLGEYPPGRRPGDVDREAGRTYLARIAPPSR